MSPAVRFLAPAAVALFATLLPAACARSVNDFEFLTPTGRVDLRADLSLPKGSQGRFAGDAPGAPDPAIRVTARFSLDPPYRAARGQSFALSYRSAEGPLRLHLFEGQGDGARKLVVDLPSGARPALGGAVDATPHGASTVSDRIRFVTPLDAGELLTGFQVTGGARAAGITIDGASITGEVPGVSFTPSETIVPRGFTVKGPAAPTGGQRSVEIDFAPLAAKLEAAQIELVYSQLGRAVSGAISVTAGRGANAKRYRLDPRAGEHRLYLYSASCGFTPERVEIVSADPGFGLLALAVRPLDAAVRSASPEIAEETERLPKSPRPPVAALSAIPANIGTIIAYDRSWWRTPDYELFSWSVAPSVLVFEFRSLELQSRYLKRLAFFVEKLGYAGRLWTNEQLAGLHGWNAHDYRSEDLARFFAAALRQGFPLNREEQELRSLLLANGVIVRASGGFGPGRGAIISFADAGSYELRRILLTHEGYHGIFFTHPAYRSRVLSLWAGADPEEQELFRRFLRAKRYDVTNGYLVANEFGAYLMQQPTAEADSYFRSEIPVDAAGRWSATGLAALFRRKPHLFETSAVEIERAAREAVGVGAGDLVELAPETRLIH